MTVGPGALDYGTLDGLPSPPITGLAYIASEFATLLATVGLVADAGTFNASISAAWRVLGVTAEPLATDSNWGDYLALLDYYALRRMQREAAQRIDVFVEVGDARTRTFGSQLAKQIDGLLATALADVQARGLDAGGGGWTEGGIPLDYIEPRSTVLHASSVVFP